MKITVDRTNNPEGDLVFTVKVKDPHKVKFSIEEKYVLESVDKLTKEISEKIDPKQIIYQKVVGGHHRLKEEVFECMLCSLKFTIQNQVEAKFNAICQEIYNWIYDHQEGYLKTWMIEFDPQRTTYYFDNDNKNNYCRDPAAISCDKEDEEDSDEDDEDDE